ncbi:MAG: hypothetical protein WBD95_12055 [Xanthobacteraceae bacterium]
MKTAVLIASGVFLASLAAIPMPAQALTAKECSAKYQAAKAAGTLAGMKWNDFRKAQCGADATAAPPPPAPTKAAAPPPPEKTAAPSPPPTGAPAEKKGSPGKQAYLARLHACSADWKTLKADGKRPAGMKWPQFWHECDQRKKAEGM